VADNLIARSDDGHRSRIVLAGHLDTVPGNSVSSPRLEGDVLRGLGSADMKGGLAVMLQLAHDVSDTEHVKHHDVTFVFYTGEEISREHSGLLQIEAADPGLLAGDAAVLGEPTDGVIEAGCQGVVKLEIVVRGERAHTARPWTGLNAIHRLAPVLDVVSRFEERRPVIDDCRYHETLQAVSVTGGIAANVVPDEATLVISHRFAPDRSESQAAAAVQELMGLALSPELGDSCTVVDTSPSAAPNLAHPVLDALVRASGAPARAKLGWTDVAFFTERGVPALNFGPGDPELAHTAGESVTRTQLQKTYDCLREVLFVMTV
jgi:succinyl-diaminopimelate desuccinylase